LTPHLPTQQAIPKSEEKQSHEKLERKSLCPLDILEAISTNELSGGGLRASEDNGSAFPPSTAAPRYAVPLSLYPLREYFLAPELNCLPAFWHNVLKDLK
jgi:hypothetical protein